LDATTLWACRIAHTGLSDQVDLKPDFRDLIATSASSYGDFAPALGNSGQRRSQGACQIRDSLLATQPEGMAHPSGSGGTSLAPTPTHPHHLSREASKDELEMAESLQRLTQAHDHTSRTATPLHAQQPHSPQTEARPEIYHSLEDAKPIVEGPATPGTSASSPLPPSSVIGISAPISGQVCR
jgi:hypothetical protein